jgi:CHAT domain-containing protein
VIDVPQILIMLRSRKARLLIVASGITAVVVSVWTVHHIAVRSRTPEGILARADGLAWNNLWIAAQPLYADAERRFNAEHKPSEALYAHVSQFIPRAESEPIPPLLVELKRDTSLPAAQDFETKLRILTIEGMIETNYDASMAKKTWIQVESLAEWRGRLRLTARAMGEQGIADFLLGDFKDAKRLVTRAWLASKGLGDPAAHVRYASLFGAGLVELQRYDEAIQALDEAIQTAAKAKGVAYPSIAVNSKIDALRGLHRYREALALADEAVRRLPSTNLDAHLFQILTSKGQVYEDEGHRSEAAAQYSAALKYARRLDYWRGIVQTGGLLAEVYEHQNQLPEALESIDEAIEANARLPQELYFSPRNLAIKADILNKMGRIKESHALYERSEELLDSLLATAPTQNVERELLAQMGQVYSGYFASLCREGDLSAAFETIEEERGRVEAQALEHHELVAPHEPTNQERKITELNLQLIGTSNSNAREALAQTLYQAELQLDDSTLAGRTAKLPMTVKAVQAQLQPEELVLEYVLAEPCSFVLAITSHSLRKYDLPSSKAIASLSAQYLKDIHDRRSDPMAAQALFNALLAPVLEYRDRTSVIIIPEGELNLLPFSALMDSGEYALKSHTFSASPSTTVLCLLRGREPATLAGPLQYVGVAAWTESAEHEGVALRGASFPDVKQLQPLPSSKIEVETIARYFSASSTVLLGSEATETKFKALPLDQYRVLHLALHGYADVEYPDRSALVFAPESGGKDDGLLEVREIRSLRLRASLVTLSACNTGVGPVGAVDVADLGNAFIEAGAESVVSTLWELEDQSTTQLMTNFYQNLSTHQSKANALRAAQLGLMRAGLPPYYWASFQVVGDPSGTL